MSTMLLACPSYRPASTEVDPFDPTGPSVAVAPPPDLSDVLPSWAKAFRFGIAPAMTLESLVTLRDGLEDDDGRILQKCITSIDDDGDMAGACPMSYAGWIGEDLRNREEVLKYYTMLATGCISALEEPGAFSWMTNFVDTTGRESMRRQLLPEVTLAIEARLIDSHS